MAPLSPDDVVLIPETIRRRVQTALDRETRHECFSVEGNRTGQHRFLRRGQPASKHVDMVFVGELPVELPKKRRIRLEVQIFYEINRAEISRSGPLYCARGS